MVHVYHTLEGSGTACDGLPAVHNDGAGSSSVAFIHLSVNIQTQKEREIEDDINSHKDIQ